MNRFTKDVRTIFSYPTLGVSELAIVMIQYLASRHERTLAEKGVFRRSNSEANFRLSREKDELNTLPNVFFRGIRL